MIERVCVDCKGPIHRKTVADASGTVLSAYTCPCGKCNRTKPFSFLDMGDYEPILIEVIER